jgi:1-phosphofructokinase
VYRRLAHDLSRNGCVVLADLSGEHLTATLAGGLYLVKVSHEELIDDGRAADDSEAALVRAMHDLLAEGARAVVVSRAEQPALALIDQQVYQVMLPELEPADPRGAGDSMTAGVAAVLASGGDLQTAVRTGAAAGAVNVIRHGLGTGRASVIAQLMERVKLTPLGPAAEGAGSAGTRAASPQELADQVRQSE